MIFKDSAVDVLRRAARQATALVNVASPARVLSYDAEARRVNIKLLTAFDYFDAEGVRRFDAPPTIANVPVLFPGNAADAITWPVEAGDHGLVIFVDRDMSATLANNDVSEPPSARRHALSDAVFLPFDLRQAEYANSVGGAVVVTNDDIRLGSTSASDAVALAPTAYANDQALKGALDAISTAAATAGAALAGFGGTVTPVQISAVLQVYFVAVQTAAAAALVTNPAASKVSAE